MCIRISEASLRATTCAIASSASAVTSLTIVAPAARARSATSAFEVSIEISHSLVSRASPSITGMTRAISSSAGTAAAPGRVDSPPTSRIPAPSASSRSPCSTAASRSRNSPPSEKESGVTLTMPMILAT